mgnify:CR=1 FL=1
MTYFKYFLKNSFKIIYLYGPLETIIFFKNFFQYKKEIDSKISIIKNDFEITNPGENFNKYLDTNYWVFENLKRIYLLNLHKKNTQSVLDLGAGAGYFAYLCQKYGHNVIALDMDNNPMYNSIIKLLGINRINHKISFGQAIPLDNNLKFNLITAFMICFNNHKQKDLWHVEEWDWFIKHLFTRLQPDGEIFLSFNEESPNEPIDEMLSNYLNEHLVTSNHLDYLLAKNVSKSTT